MAVTEYVKMGYGLMLLKDESSFGADPTPDTHLPFESFSYENVGREYKPNDIQRPDMVELPGAVGLKSKSNFETGHRIDMLMASFASYTAELGTSDVNALCKVIAAALGGLVVGGFNDVLALSDVNTIKCTNQASFEVGQAVLVKCGTRYDMAWIKSIAAGTLELSHDLVASPDTGIAGAVPSYGSITMFQPTDGDFDVASLAFWYKGDGTDISLKMLGLRPNNLTMTFAVGEYIKATLGWNVATYNDDIDANGNPAPLAWTAPLMPFIDGRFTMTTSLGVTVAWEVKKATLSVQNTVEGIEDMGAPTTGNIREWMRTNCKATLDIEVYIDGDISLYDQTWNILYGSQEAKFACLSCVKQPGMGISVAMPSAIVVDKEPRGKADAKTIGTMNIKLAASRHTGDAGAHTATNTPVRIALG